MQMRGVDGLDTYGLWLGHLWLGRLQKSGVDGASWVLMSCIFDGGMVSDLCYTPRSVILWMIWTGFAPNLSSLIWSIYGLDTYGLDRFFYWVRRTIWCGHVHLFVEIDFTLTAEWTHFSRCLSKSTRLMVSVWWHTTAFSIVYKISRLCTVIFFCEAVYEVHVGLNLMREFGFT